MSEAVQDSNPICKAYPKVKIFQGCAMDEASYERHKNTVVVLPPAAPPPPQSGIPVTEDYDDPFAKSQDLHSIAAQAIQQHNQHKAFAPQPSSAPAPVYIPSNENPSLINMNLSSYAGSYGGSYAGSYSSSFGGSYSGSYAGSYNGSFSGSYSGSYNGSYNGSYSGSYNGSYAEFPEVSSDIAGEIFAIGSDMHLLGGYGIDII